MTRGCGTPDTTTRIHWKYPASASLRGTAYFFAFFFAADFLALAGDFLAAFFFAAFGICLYLRNGAPRALAFDAALQPIQSIINGFERIATEYEHFSCVSKRACSSKARSIDRSIRAYGSAKLESRDVFGVENTPHDTRETAQNKRFLSRSKRGESTPRTASTDATVVRLGAWPRASQSLKIRIAKIARGRSRRSSTPDLRLLDPLSHGVERIDTALCMLVTLLTTL